MIDTSKLTPTEDGNYRTAGGLILLAPGTLRAWIKLKGEPAQIFAESPQEFIERWLAFTAGEDAYTAFHVYEYGHAAYFLRSALDELCYVQVSLQTRPPRSLPGSCWLGQCSCLVCSQGWRPQPPATLDQDQKPA